jgi:hypothetical protein
VEAELAAQTKPLAVEGFFSVLDASGGESKKDRRENGG